VWYGLVWIIFGLHRLRGRWTPVNCYTTPYEISR